MSSYCNRAVRSSSELCTFVNDERSVFHRINRATSPSVLLQYVCIHSQKYLQCTVYLGSDFINICMSLSSYTGQLLFFFPGVQKLSRYWSYEGASHIRPMEAQIKRLCGLGSCSSEAIGCCSGCECLCAGTAGGSTCFATKPVSTPALTK